MFNTSLTGNLVGKTLVCIVKLDVVELVALALDLDPVPLLVARTIAVRDLEPVPVRLVAVLVVEAELRVAEVDRLGDLDLSESGDGSGEDKKRRSEHVRLCFRVLFQGG